MGFEGGVWGLDFTQRLHSSSFLGVLYRILLLLMNRKKELPWSLWAELSAGVYTGLERMAHLEAV